MPAKQRKFFRLTWRSPGRERRDYSPWLPEVELDQQIVAHEVTSSTDFRIQAKTITVSEWRKVDFELYLAMKGVR